MPSIVAMSPSEESEARRMEASAISRHAQARYPADHRGGPRRDHGYGLPRVPWSARRELDDTWSRPAPASNRPAFPLWHGNDPTDRASTSLRNVKHLWQGRPGGHLRCPRHERRSLVRRLGAERILRFCGRAGHRSGGRFDYAIPMMTTETDQFSRPQNIVAPALSKRLIRARPL
jgi:hypothetical protein